MALIGEIRKRSWLLLVVIAIAMLAFVLGDVFRNQGGQTNETPVTNVFGEGMTQSEYDYLMKQEIEKNRRVIEKVYGRQFTAEDQARVEDNFMSQTLAERLYASQYAKVGLTVSEEEYNDVLQGEHVDGSIFESFGLFVNPLTNKFSRDSMRRRMPLMLQQNPEMNYFIGSYIGDIVEKQRLRNKYNTLIEKGLYTTSYEAKKQNAANLTSVNFDFVYKSFASIPDSLINVDDNAIRTYYSKHKNEDKYKQQDGINFQYVEFAVEPSADDKESAKDYLQTKIKYFKDADNDSAFVYTNSDSKDLNFAAKKASDFPASLDATIQGADTGDIVGPYIDGDYYKISKVRDISTQTEAKVRHILIGKDNPGRGSSRYGSDIARLKQIADSVIRVIRAKNNFEAMVAEMSTDIASVPKGGVYDWFDESVNFVPPFKDAAFNNPVKSIRAVETEFGIHIMEVMGRRQGKVLNVATVDAVIKPSKKTIDLAIDKAIEFRNNFTKENVADTTFVNTARRNGFIVANSQAGINQKEIPSIGSASQVLRWGFASTTTVGDLSNEMVFEDKVIIAQLQKRTEEGVPTFDAVKNQMAFEVTKEKKAEVYASKMKGATLQDIATNVGETVKTAAGVTLAQSSIPGAGNEPAVVGKAHATPLNTVSSVITGNQGLFVVMPTVSTPAPADADFSSQQVTSTAKLRSRAQNEVFQALYKLGDVKDKRDELRYKQ